MSNVKIDVLLRAVDQATRPLASIQTASKSLSGDLRDTRQSLSNLNSLMANIDGFRTTRTQLTATGQALKNAREEASALAIAFKNTENPTRVQSRALESSRRNVTALKLEQASLRQSLQMQRQDLLQAGVSTRRLVSEKRQLKSAIGETTMQLEQQRTAMTRVNAQQARLQAVQRRYATGKALAGNVASVGAAGVSAATTGATAAGALLEPGYAFAQKNAALQAVLGMERNAPQMEALRSQAREADGSSPVDAASAQLVIAQGGGGVAAIEALMPVVRNMSLANQQSLEANATTLMAADGGALEQYKATYANPQDGARDSLGGDVMKLQAAYESISIDLFAGQESSLRKLVQTATGYLVRLDNWINNNKELANTLMVIGASIVAVIGFIGAIASVVWPVITGVNLIIAAAGSLGTVFSVVGGGIAAVVGTISAPVIGIGLAIAAAALLVYKYWEPISAFLGGLFEGISIGISEVFAPLQPVFEWLGSGLGKVWQMFTDLIEPIHASQESLNSFRDAGVLVGKKIAEMLLYPLSLLNKVREGFNALMGRLGPDGPTKEAMARDDYIKPTSTLRSYDALTAPAGRTINDNSQSTFNFTLTGGATVGPDFEQRIKLAIEQSEREKQSQRSSSLRHS